MSPTELTNVSYNLLLFHLILFPLKGFKPSRNKTTISLPMKVLFCSLSKQNFFLPLTTSETNKAVFNVVSVYDLYFSLLGIFPTDSFPQKETQLQLFPCYARNAGCSFDDQFLKQDVS
jgi:hypothetical protein